MAEDGVSEVEEEYKTYLIGGSLVGLPSITYGRSPFASWGVTGLIPDVMDLFIEDVKEEQGLYFDALTG